MTHIIVAEHKQGAPMLDLDDLYAAIDCDAALGRLAQTVAGLCGTRSARVDWRDPITGWSLQQMNYWPGEQIGRYYAHFAEGDPWWRTLERGAPGIIMADALVPPEEVMRSAMYQELFVPMGDDTARALAYASAGDRPDVILTVHRGGTDRPFGSVDARRLDSVRDHLGRVLALRARLAGAETAARGATELVDATGKAVLRVAKDLRLLECSAAARARLDARDGVQLRGGRLCFRDGALETAIRAAVRSVIDRADPVRSSFAVPRAGGARPLLLFVLPAGSSASFGAVITLDDPALPPGESARRALAELYALSPAEVSVALALGQGDDVGAIAETRGVARETVRTQAKNIYAKTGVARQAELARLLAALPSRP